MDRTIGWTLLCLLGWFVPSLLGAQVTVPPPPAAARPLPVPHPVLDRILARQTLLCGLAKEEEDYSRATDHGNRAAFDIDLCKAMTVALLGPGTRVVVKSYPDEPAALAALAIGEVDVVASASETVANTARGLLFTAPVLWDGQGFLLPNNPAVHTPADLAGKRVCFLTGSAAEAGLHSYAEAHGISYIWYPFSEAGEMEAAFFTGNCDAITSDVTSLANIRAIDAQRSRGFTILPETVRDEPLAVAVLGTDSRLWAIANWTVETLIMGEQLGITQATVGTLSHDPRPAVQQLLGQPFGTGSALGLAPHWGAAVIEAVGTYGELFDRDLGTGSALRLDRGENRLARDGGKMVALPLTDR